jgi:hypothetical protein
MQYLSKKSEIFSEHVV